MATDKTPLNLKLPTRDHAMMLKLQEVAMHSEASRLGALIVLGGIQLLEADRNGMLVDSQELEMDTPDRIVVVVARGQAAADARRIFEKFGVDTTGHN